MTLVSDTIPRSKNKKEDRRYRALILKLKQLEGLNKEIEEDITQNIRGVSSQALFSRLYWQVYPERNNLKEVALAFKYCHLDVISKIVDLQRKIDDRFRTIRDVHDGLKSLHLKLPNWTLSGLENGARFPIEAHFRTIVYDTLAHDPVVDERIQMANFTG